MPVLTESTTDQVGITPQAGDPVLELQDLFRHIAPSSESCLSVISKVEEF